MTAARPAATSCGGGACGRKGTLIGQTAFWRVRCHATTSLIGRGPLPCGLKNRSPSQ